MDMMKQAKKTMKVGIGTMVGMGAVGSIANLPGMPVAAKTSAGVVNTGLGLANVGVLAETGMGLGRNLCGKGGRGSCGGVRKMDGSGRGVGNKDRKYHKERKRIHW